ncbi:MAG: hypothetical protein KGI50_06805, partial [Patescibacteria group bacterium]|nr:hypothetical protein [Patescibacteria group bacterium]
MDRTLAQSIVRIGKELAAALEQKSESGAIVGKQGLRLTNYSSDYILGLGVSLGILWECVNHKPLGSAHQLTL